MATPVQTPPVSEVSDFQLLNQPTDQNEAIEATKEEAKDIVIAITRSIDVQERPTREILIKVWKYLDLLWTGVSNFYWNSTSNQWKPITYDDVRHLSESADIDPTLLNKTINMIRPYGESIIGAVTTTLPVNKYYPDNADDIDDINTSRAYINIEKKICLDNQMKIKIVQMIMNLLTGGFFAAYNYSHKSEEYGTVSQPTYDQKKFRISSISCANCGAVLNTTEEEVNDDSVNVESGLEETINEDFEQKESGNEPDLQGILQESIEDPQIESITCPECSTQAPPVIDQDEESRNIQSGTIVIPKCRQLIDIYGPLQVKIPTHASRKEEILWCILEDEIHESHARELYPDHWDKIKPGSKDDLAYDRWARSQYENMGELNQYYVTRRRVWLRPSAYNVLGDKDKAEKLKLFFPKGVMATYMNQDLLELEESELDDHWTFSFNPIYRRYYGDPLLKAAIPLQETANDLFQLEIETVKYSIPMAFADPAYFDFEAYSKSKAQPGVIYPMQTPPGGNLQNAIAETRTANLPKEVEVLEEKLEKLFQFILGVFPSVFGGEASGSKTLGEYEQSRAQALQRLGINPLEVVKAAYAEMMAKSIKAYTSDLLEDEAYVQAKGNTFINVWIRKADLQGKVGRVVPEQSDQFPMSWGQKKAAWMELLGLNNELIISILFHPENIGYLKDMLSLDDLYIPGDDQRNKQLEEIKNLITPAGIDPMSGMPIPNQVPVEPVDDHNIHLQVISAFICSQVGQALKENNPAAYQALLMHSQEHQMIIQQQMMAQQAQMSQEQGNSDSNSTEKVGESNA